MPKYVIAVDGGGTKTHALCAEVGGGVIGEGVSGPTSLAATTVGAASFNLKEAIRQATEKLPPETVYERLIMGLAGMDTAEEEKQARAVFTDGLAHVQVNEFVLVNDTLIALESGSNDPNSLVVIAGTGSNCMGRNQEGQMAKAGGMDYLLTDQGSGYAIGRAVLRQAVKSFDGRGAKTELEQYVCQHFRIETLADLKTKVYNPPLNKTEVAELAQLALRAYDQGDEVAKRIFELAGDELVCMAKAVLTKLNLLSRPATCVLAGSITKISYFNERLNRELTALNPQLTIAVPTQAPVHGALEMALRNLV